MCKSVAMSLLLNTDLIIVTICILLLASLVLYCFSDTGYYVKHYRNSKWFGICHRDQGAWYNRTSTGSTMYLYAMGDTNFKRYCNKHGIARYWQMLKAQAQ